MLQQKEHSGPSDRRPEDKTAGVFQVPAEGHRSFSGSSDRRRETI